MKSRNPNQGKISATESARRINLVAESEVSEIKETILGTCSMIICASAEIFQMIQTQNSEHLSQKQEQPIDPPLLRRNHRPHSVLQAAEFAPWIIWVHPLARCSVVKRILVFLYETRDLFEFRNQVILDLVHSLAPPAPDLATDRDDPVRFQVAQSVDHRSARRRPQVRWPDLPRTRLHTDRPHRRGSRIAASAGRRRSANYSRIPANSV